MSARLRGQVVAGSSGSGVSHVLSFAALGCLVCCGALVSRGAPISACLLPVGLRLAPCTDFADWERVSPAPPLVALQLAISLSLEFLESRRCPADTVTPSAAALGRLLLRWVNTRCASHGCQ